MLGIIFNAESGSTMANFHYRLLIVDDDPLGRDLLHSSLSARGFDVAVAKDGFAALDQMHGALPDVIVSDLKMPNMSGFEFLSIARRRFPQIPTIAVSGEFHPPIEPLGVLADGFLAKPFRIEELLAKIEELLHDAPPRPAINQTGTSAGLGAAERRLLRNYLHRLPAFVLHTGREKCPAPSRASYVGVHFLRCASSVYRRRDAGSSGASDDQERRGRVNRSQKKGP